MIGKSEAGILIYLRLFISYDTDKSFVTSVPQVLGL